MMRRLASVSAAAAAAPSRGCGGAGKASASVATVASARLFSSDYSNAGNYKPPIRAGGRSGAHRRTVKQNYPRKSDSPARQVADDDGDRRMNKVYENDFAAIERDEEIPPAQRNYKNRYQDLFKPKQQPVSFTSSFKADTAATAVADAPEEDEDADLTKIYSHEEVARMVRTDGSSGAPRHGGRAATAAAEDADVLRALEEDDAAADGGAVVSRDYNALEEDGGEADAEAPAAAAEEEDGEGAFTDIRSHPFYADLIKRVEKNMGRHRKDIRLTGTFSQQAINDCVRPLLQLADYPFTTSELARLAGSINAVTLQNSLPNHSACRRLHVYRSPDTDLILDWSVEDFLRRRYESVHMSWEPMDVVRRRFGWNGDHMSDRDLLLYFAEFGDFVELAELEYGPDGKPTAVPIADAVDQAQRAPIPASRLLIRRVPDEDTEPSLTESIRLMGAPALSSTERKGGHHNRRGSQNDSVSGMFAAVEKAAADVDGDEASKLMHGMDATRSLRQATHPGGRTINEFSLGKRRDDARAGADAAAGKSGGNMFRDQHAAAEEEGAASGDGDDNAVGAHFDPHAYETLSNAYHKTKVEITLLRRRMLNSDSASQAESMQAKLAQHRRELSRLNEKLRRMSALRHQQQIEIEEGHADDASGDVHYDKEGFAIPRSRPRYAEAPELDSKNVEAAANGEEDDDIDISAELQEYEEIFSPSASSAQTDAAAATKTHARSTWDIKEARRRRVAQDDVEVANEEDEEPASPSLAVPRPAVKTRAAHSTAKADVAASVDGDDFDPDEYVATGKRSSKAPAAASSFARHYAEAPEHDEALVEALANDDDEDIDITAALEEYEAELQRPYADFTAKVPHSGRASVRRETATAATAAAEAADAEGEWAEELAEAAAATATNGAAAAAAAAAEDEAAVPRSAALAKVVEQAAAAVDVAREALDTILQEKTEAEAAMAHRVGKATEKVERLETALGEAMEEHREAVESEQRAAAEAKARAVEQELEAQRQRRVAEVARQREEARLAQLEAQKAIERQRKAEEEALAMERELEEKLARVRAQLRGASAAAVAAGSSVDVEAVVEDQDEEPAHDRTAAEATVGDRFAGAGDGAARDAPTSSSASADVVGEEDYTVTEAQHEAAAVAEEADEPTAATTAAAEMGVDATGAVFMCSPEQYDGLHLAADRLRSEISALEQQMEQEGDEDDETLMAVLAESRSDLEELDECIHSVQQNATWAAGMDAKRERERRAMEKQGDSAAQLLQAQIDNHRFQIDLLEKRLHHATARSVSNKLEQGIVAARREIAKLRREQDRLRREGRDTFGFPASVSIAEALAGEGREQERKKREEEAAVRAAVNETAPDAAEDSVAADGESAAKFDDEQEGRLEAASATDDAAGDGDAAASPSAQEAVVGSDAEAHRLRLRLDSMLQDIQQLQDNIAVQERTSDYDDDETASVLLEMKTKLGQLLHLRNAVQQRLASGGGAADAAPVVAPSITSSATTVMTESPPAPAPHQQRAWQQTRGSFNSSNNRFRPASKKIRKVARSSRR